MFRTPTVKGSDHLDGIVPVQVHGHDHGIDHVDDHGNGDGALLRRTTVSICAVPGIRSKGSITSGA